MVTDIYGRSVKQQIHTLTNGNQEIWLNLATLPTGTYQVTGYLQNGEKTSSIRFIKQ
ncbi:T9SS type A sorting domain-containing protein [Paraflavitalea speifideaquila]|uniref:T9SS type A sorting domain-containing protein n=1 Tax=Paraflavitalea speifideaquila TaxID=3076558 RepID=UPI0028EBFD3C|nr:T9SS type A sorting domain-containing protein [Paraflavitalea speifideiaquila]